MATNLRRLITSLPSPGRTGLEHPLRSATNTVSRLVFSSAAEKPESEGQSAKEGEREPTKNDKKETDEGRDRDRDEEDDDVSKRNGEIGGPRGPEPTRYGDWERNGRCYDF